MIFSPKPWDLRVVWLFCLTFRIFNGLFVQTYFNPGRGACVFSAAPCVHRCSPTLAPTTHADEFWQNQEVAHRFVFGPEYGYLTWEWMPFARIRSSVAVLPTALLYAALKRAQLDTQWLVVQYSGCASSGP